MKGKVVQHDIRRSVARTAEHQTLSSFKEFVMKHVRPLLLVASTLALFVSACSQAPADVQAPLGPQYGSALDDVAKSIAVNPSGAVYALSLEQADNQGSSYGDKLGVLTLRRFDRSGTQVWKATQDFGFCNADLCTTTVLDVATDVFSNAYVIYTSGQDGYLDFLVKYDKNGARQWQRPLRNGYNFTSPLYLDVAADSKGAVYVAEYYYDDASGEDVSRLVKYAPSGTTLWAKTVNVTQPQAVAVASDDTVYVAGAQNFARYSSDGSQRWLHTFGDAFKTPGFNSAYGAGIFLAISGSGTVYVGGNTFYALYPTEPKENQVKLLKYSSAGSQGWTKTMPSLGDARLYGVTADAQGGVYLTGRTDSDWNGQSQPVTDYFARKYNAAGSLVWSRTAELPGTQVATDIAAFGADELYVTGLTNGKVNGTNFGRNDAFLLRLNGQGNRVWSR